VSAVLISVANGKRLIMIPSVREVFPPNDFVFQQKIFCSVHTARMVTEWFQNQNINLLDWPSLRPDLNPIENMWGLMVKTMKKRYSGFQNKDDLLAGITVIQGLYK
jgi:hypothetical protein